MVFGITKRTLLLWSEVGEDALEEADPCLIKVFQLQLLLLVFLRIELECADLDDDLLGNCDQLLILLANANISDQVEECPALLDHVFTLILASVRARRFVEPEQERL